ncbi:MAG: fumarylacetoacetate hydrolase family protein, partial [Nitrososphaerota archaeon]
MRVATFQSGGRLRLGVVRGEHMVDVAQAAELLGQSDLSGAASGMLSLIAGGDQALQAVTAVAERAPEDALLPLETVELVAPIPRPRKNVLCVGRNYAEHAAESLAASGQAFKLPEFPNIFTKAVTTVIGPTSDIPFDAAVSERIDWEVELG